MTLYQRILQYYITSSSYFIDEAEWFWEINNHKGICSTQHYHFESEIYRKYSKKLQNDGGYTLLLSDKVIENYFTNITLEEKLFAVIFSHWLELSPSQINSILKSKELTGWKRLQKYIGNNCKYYINIGTSEIHGQFRDNAIFDSSGIKFEIE